MSEKIEMVNDIKSNDNIKIMTKPIYKINFDERFGMIEYNNKIYIIDEAHFENLINYKKKFTFTNEDDDYPSYNINERSVNYLEHLYKLKREYTTFTFKNGNKFDLRKDNVLTVQNFVTVKKLVIENKITESVENLNKEKVEKVEKVENEQAILPTNIRFNKLLEERHYKILEIITNGHIPTMGRCAGQYKNPIYKCTTDKNIEQLIMYCETDALCFICQESLNKIAEFEKEYNDNKKLVFYKHSNGYVLCSNENLYIHQIITGCHGNGKGTKEISVDHIDQNPLNNTFANLRIATRKDQENNSKGIKEGTKRARKQSAKALPEGITQDMMKKYVVYYEECYDKAKDLHRKFFKVETHPKLDKPYISSKSNKVTIQEKLDEVNKVVMDLDNDIHPDKNEDKLPTGIYIKIARDKPHLIFDKRCDDGQRMNVRMVLKADYDLQDELAIFREKIKEKYDIVV